MNLYAEQIVDLYKNPLNKRTIKNATLTHSGTNATCGDHIRIYLKVKNGRIIDASFMGEGCAISVAAASLLTEELKGKLAKSVLKIKKEDLFKLLGVDLGPSRTKCGMLALEVTQEGIKKNK